ncbi:XRE family transcriptional regulator [Actinoallomurus sp. NPDC052308]|uniref:XRE family transcriptional regulator n=1 Tax=Actinoallomurus sp. NPDC052308 TaxID=3155530 RepID=UPI00342BDCF3
MNAKLSAAITASGMDESEIARRLGVDPKTVKRWIRGRLPYPRHRRILAETLGAEEEVIWPHAERMSAAAAVKSVDIKSAYAHRWAVPREVWLTLFASAEHEIGVLAYAALFLAEDNGIMRVLADRARAGVHVRILLGRPEGSQVSARGSCEGINNTIAAKIRNAITLYGPLAEIDGVQLRLHDTALYASIYRADDHALVNTHIYGAPASHAPVFEIRHTAPNDIAETYFESFNRVWAGAMEYE